MAWNLMRVQKASGEALTSDGFLPLSTDARVTALVVGSGLSTALNRESPGWGALLAEIRGHMKAEGTPSEDVMAEALRLSRRSSRRRDARPTTFQEACQTALARYWPMSGATPAQSETWKKDRAALVTAFRNFLATLRCNVIVDLNYDPAVEFLLAAGGIPYIKATGSEVHWTGPLAAGAVLLWKVHGDLLAPSTIVLSPSEYQRIYEINALGSELLALGRSLEGLVSIGAGLQDDDIWAYLCGGTNDFPIIALLLSKEIAEPLPASFSEWWKLVERLDRQPFVLRGTYSGVPLETHLDEIAKAALSMGAKPEVPSLGGPVSAHMRKRLDEFEAQYERYVSGPHATALALVSDFKGDFDALREHLLSYGAAGAFGPRWCPDIRPAGNVDRAKLAHGLREIVIRSVDLHERERKVLATAAAQATIGYVVELAELHGLEPHIEQQLSDVAFVSKKRTLLVGSNPFFASVPDRENIFHVVQVEKAFAIAAPILGGSLPKTHSTMKLLTEDEWEAANLAVYFGSRPELTFDPRLGLEPARLLTVPPLYPWGFRLLDIGNYRAKSTGSVSRCWHLTSTVLPSGDQICKGGGARDRGRRAFRLGGRGQLRIGEYDDFLEPAYRYELE